MMNQCAHENISITEIYKNHTAAHYKSDGKWTHNLEPGDLTGQLIVECEHCGLNKYYTRSTTPKWVKNLLEEAVDYRLSMGSDGDE